MRLVFAAAWLRSGLLIQWIDAAGKPMPLSLYPYTTRVMQ